MLAISATMIWLILFHSKASTHLFITIYLNKACDNILYRVLCLKAHQVVVQKWIFNDLKKEIYTQIRYKIYV